jgi:enoyl-CoA hydratase/carnithine racemase
MARLLTDLSEPNVLRVTLDRPSVHNALDFEMLAELGKAVAQHPQSKVLILKGAGSRAFSSGFDLTRLSGTDADLAADDAIGGVVDALRSFPGVSIAQISGICQGGATEIALACDVRIAEEGLSFAFDPIRLGVLYRHEMLVRLVELCGVGRTTDLFFHRPTLDAATAYAWGLISAVVPVGDLDGAVRSVAQRIVTMPDQALRGTKRLLALLREDPALWGGAGEARELRQRVLAGEERRDALRAARERLDLKREERADRAEQ